MLGKRRILIVDDDPGMRETLADILENMGYDVAVADSGQRAVEMMTGCLFDVALMDIMMPGMNGVEALKKIKAVCPGWKVLIMTASQDDALIDEALQEGAGGIYYKPLDVKSLLAGLQKMTADIKLPDC